MSAQAFLFLEYLLRCLEPGGIAIALMPMSCARSESPYKKQLMREHSLIAVATTPTDLFDAAGAKAPTCLMVLVAHQPHDLAQPVWFVSWEDDGFKGRNRAGVETQEQWLARAHAWLEMYRQRQVIPDVSLLTCVGPSDDWHFEAHIQTEYTGMVSKDFFDARMNTYSFSARYFAAASKGMAVVNRTPLDLSSWRAFNLSDWFEMKRGDGSICVKDLLKEVQPGAIPVISSSTKNNGVAGYISGEPQFPAGCISIASGGDGAGTAFYHAYPCSATGHTCILMPKFAMDDDVCLFLTVILNRESPKYAYGRDVTVTRLKRTSIQLPADATGQPDWQFMRNYMRHLRIASLN